MRQAGRERKKYTSKKYFFPFLDRLASYAEKKNNKKIKENKKIRFFFSFFFFYVYVCMTAFVCSVADENPES